MTTPPPAVAKDPRSARLHELAMKHLGPRGTPSPSPSPELVTCSSEPSPTVAGPPEDERHDAQDRATRLARFRSIRNAQDEREREAQRQAAREQREQEKAAKRRAQEEARRRTAELRRRLEEKRRREVQERRERRRARIPEATWRGQKRAMMPSTQRKIDRNLTHRALLARAVAHAASRRASGYATSGEVYAAYRELPKPDGFPTLTARRVTDLLLQMAQAAQVQRHPHEGGRYGRTHLYAPPLPLPAPNVTEAGA